MGRSSTVIRRAAELGRHRVPFLLGLAAIIFVPLGLLDALDKSLGGIDTDTINDAELAAMLLATAVHIGSSLLGEIIFAGAVATATVSTPPGANPQLGEILRETRWGTLVAIDVLFALGMFCSALLLLIPVFFFFSRYVLAPVLAEVEGRGVRDSFRRSAELTRGSRRLVLGVLFVAAAIGELATRLAQETAQALGAGGFLATWFSSSAVEVLYNPIVALLSVAIVLELGGRPSDPVRARAA